MQSPKALTAQKCPLGRRAGPNSSQELSEFGYLVTDRSLEFGVKPRHSEKGRVLTWYGLEEPPVILLREL